MNGLRLYILKMISLSYPNCAIPTPNTSAWAAKISSEASLLTISVADAFNVNVPIRELPLVSTDTNLSVVPEFTNLTAVARPKFEPFVVEVPQAASEPNTLILLIIIIPYYATTVIEPAAVPIAPLLVIVELVLVPLSLIVPEFKFIALAPITNTSSAFVAALPAAIASVNTSSLVPVPDAYGKLCGPLPEPVPWLPLVTAR